MKIYHLLILSLAFIACEKQVESPDSTYEAAVAFNLAYQETASCNDCEGPEIYFADVLTDSRCPLAAHCIWEGEVVVEVEIDGAPTLMALSPIDTAPDEVTVGEWIVKLRSVSPYPTQPVEDDEIDPSIYSMELLVEMI